MEATELTVLAMAQGRLEVPVALLVETRQPIKVQARVVAGQIPELPKIALVVMGLLLRRLTVRTVAVVEAEEAATTR